MSRVKEVSLEMRDMGINFGFLSDVTSEFKPDDFGTTIYNGEHWMLMSNYTSNGKARRVVRVLNKDETYSYYYLNK